MSRIGDFDFVTLSLSLSLSSIYDKLRTMWLRTEEKYEYFSIEGLR